MLTHGERVLAAAEGRARAMKARRRIVMLGGPALLATSTATLALIAEQHARRSAFGPGLRLLVADLTLIVFTVAFVAVPLFGAARTARAMPALVAFIAGPIMTPRLFGAGGWRWWETTVVVVVTVAISSAALRRRASRRRRASSVPR